MNGMLFKSEFVQVTSTVARFGDTSYQIANIESVRMTTMRRASPPAQAQRLENGPRATARGVARKGH